MASNEPASVRAFREWFSANGGSIHEDAYFEREKSGMGVYAKKGISSGQTIVSCPISLAVTDQVARDYLVAVLSDPHQVLEKWSSRELICSYIVMHWVSQEVDPEENSSRPKPLHRPYLDILPPAPNLKTPLQFTDAEIDLLKGTNLHGAALDRIEERSKEWKRCLSLIRETSQKWADAFTWERYKTAATYLSSRAFPSSLLSSSPSLSDPNSTPVLLPGVDSLNHSRGQPVSWVVSNLSNAPTEERLAISLVSRADIHPNSEILNNYGLKSNAELILGYGFALPKNPEDTLVLKLGSSSVRHEITRSGDGIEEVCQELALVLKQQLAEESIEDWDLDLEVLDRFKEMMEVVSSKLYHAGARVEEPEGDVQADVRQMMLTYIAGQLDVSKVILQSLDERWQKALQVAEEQGVEVEF
ncbi:SET domain-containing protein [Sistotremastrum niveocremeum HHB9708]|uniref:SET domain-containing protein n=1 Tax=Sistotremastrum niveocremeum HHB9708 TaxID=1314777 RepID=A0A164UN25_9AGAM|nr:SET domain-containing protein [Sistotremastrum niveocremeum HHB9708]